MTRKFVSDTRAAVGAEFALLVGLFLLMLFGIIDAARFAWVMNESQKASQAAVRHAVVTDFVAPGIEAYDFTDAGYVGGDPIPVGDVTGEIECDNDGCSGDFTVVRNGDVISPGFEPDPFDLVVQRSQASFPGLRPENLEIVYRHVGLGYAGDPNGADIAPLVIARVTGIQFQPSILLGLAITLPPVEASMTMEDGQGVKSYSA